MQHCLSTRGLAIQRACLPRVHVCSWPRAGALCPFGHRRQTIISAAPGGENLSLDVRNIAELIAAAPLDPERKEALDRLVLALGVPLGTAKQMVYKRKALLELSNEELRDKLQRVAEVVEVPLERAREMVAIQPGLLIDTEKQAEALKMGIRAICYELKATKEEVVDLILNNQSVLHGREMHLSVADIAHLAMLREPVGRIVD